MSLRAFSRSLHLFILQVSCWRQFKVDRKPNNSWWFLSWLNLSGKCWSAVSTTIEMLFWSYLQHQSSDHRFLRTQTVFDSITCASVLYSLNHLLVVASLFPVGLMLGEMRTLGLHVHLSKQGDWGNGYQTECVVRPLILLFPLFLTQGPLILKIVVKKWPNWFCNGLWIKKSKGPQQRKLVRGAPRSAGPEAIALLASGLKPVLL